MLIIARALTSLELQRNLLKLVSLTLKFAEPPTMHITSLLPLGLNEIEVGLKKMSHQRAGLQIWT